MAIKILRIAYQSIFLLFLLLVDNSIAEKSPIITSVEQIDETGIRIRWDDHNDKQTNLIRYRIFYSNDSFNQDLNEWPGQIEKSQQHLIGDLYQTLIVNSSFECYIDCVKNPGCDFAVSTEGTKCHLKIYNPKSFNLQLNASTLTDYGEYIFIPKYTNEVVLRDLPANSKYYFQVATLQKNSYEFSQLSPVSEPIEYKIVLRIFSDKTEQNRVRIFWRQMGTFQNHEISRYTVKIWSNNEISQNYSVTDGIQTTKVNHEYFDLTSAFSVGKVTDESECFERCLANSTCIKYSMFADRECCLMSSLDLHNSVYKVQHSAIGNLKSPASSYVLENLKPNVVWNVQVEYRNMFGSVGVSNIIEVIQDEIEEEKESTTSPITTTITTTSTTTTTTTSTTSTGVIQIDDIYDDYSDLDDITPVETNGEPTSTASTTTSKTKSGDNDYDYYDFYSDLDDVIPPEKVTTTTKTKTASTTKTTATTTTFEKDDDSKTTIYNPDHNYDDYYDETENNDAATGRIIVLPDNNEARTEISINIDQPLAMKNIGDKLNIKCLSGGDIFWKFNGMKLKSDNKLTKSGYEAALVFDNLQRYNQGLYTCNLANDDTVYKTAKILIDGTPSKPVIRNVSTFETSTLIEWNQINLYGAIVQKVFIEWSEDFTNGLLPVKKRISNTNESPDILNNKIELDLQIPENVFVRISILNNFNEFSPVSEPVRVYCRHSNCESEADDPKAAEVKEQDTKKKHKHLKRTFNSATVTLLSLIGILLVLISGYIVYDCMRKNKTQKIILKDENNKRYNKVPTESEI